VKRPVGSFSAITVQLAARVTILPGEKEEVSIKADPQFLPQLTSEVRGSTLTLSHTGPLVLVNQTIDIDVRFKTLKRLEFTGSGTIEAKDVQTDTLTVTQSGSGTLTVSGQADVLNLTLSGSGPFHGYEFATKRAVVDVRGFAKAVVNVANQLDVTLEGPGSVDYRGNPQVRRFGSGKGPVRPIP
jgi:hypothetical protein